MTEDEEDILDLEAAERAKKKGIFIDADDLKKELGIGG